ncbi:hypothetical protein [Sodalis sp. dw_96]|uniref:hypothetical protein n=1 Tax=Sodalis sp. dw_96 TaxID=2719794 RepID=UPI001BD6CA27|nr:hypothetical protein [Sodalis sp. dw_96]
MFIDNSSRRYDYIPMTALLSETNADMSTRIQAVSNTAPSLVQSCIIGISCGVLMAATTYISGKAITNAVYDLNNFLALGEPGPNASPKEIIHLGLNYGALGGIITGLSAAMVLRQCVKISNRPDFYADHKNILFIIGGTVGMGLGSLTGAMYSVALNHWLTINNSES